ncbi:MAG TPA: hypothetical protein PK760_06420, partial [Flavobacteriales bacterium]|nr:hypothetical protein [Flavobacteriales bacterium]
MRLLPFLLLLVSLASCSPHDPSTDVAKEAKQIEAVFETKEKYSVRSLDSLDIERYLSIHPEHRIDSTEIRRFYKRRQFQYAWFVNDSLSQAASGFFSLVNGADTAFRDMADVRDRLAELLMAPDSGAVKTHCDSCQLQLELGLTAQFFRFADKRYNGVVGKDLRDLDWFIPRRKKN